MSKVELRIGCRSQLEIHGYRQVFDHRLLSGVRLQLPIRLSPRTIYLDVAFEERCSTSSWMSRSNHRIRNGITSAMPSYLTPRGLGNGAVTTENRLKTQVTAPLPDRGSGGGRVTAPLPDRGSGGG